MPNKTSRITHLFFTLLFFNFITSIAQNQNHPIVITGRVLEKSSNQPLPYATIVVKDISTKKPLEGTSSDENGNFKITSKSSSVYVEVSFMGYKPKLFKNLDTSTKFIDLGKITLEENSQALGEVTIRAEKSKTEFKLDRKVFNVGKDISSTGASALEVLNNVPSVDVNIEGQISLRGNNGVQILINGKPSILTEEGSNALGTITADMIDSIEVITNPSAKYDAEGTTGILNIILKKNNKKGVNGSISVNIGEPENHSIGLSLNRRTEKFNLFTQLGMGYRSLPFDNKSTNSNLNTKTSVTSFGKNYRNETFYNITLGTDYHINDNNVVTLSGNFAYEIEEQPSRTDFELFNNNILTSKWFRTEITDATNPKWQYELQYKKEFKNNKKHALLFSAQGRFFGKDQDSQFNNIEVSGTVNDVNQIANTTFKQEDYTFKLDYTNPISEKFTLETGSQYVINDVGNNYAVRDSINGVWVLNPGLTNDFDYDQKVFGIYGTGAYEYDKWGLKLGLRVEDTNLKTFLANTNTKNTQKYTDVFPSAHTSYKLTENTSLQLGYSRRIFRPRLWDLNPFFNVRNNYNIYTGNPNLQPEYTNSYEVTGIFPIGKATINSSIYNRYTTSVIERVLLTNTSNITTRKPINIGTNNALGFEINGKYAPTKKLSFNANFNLNTFKREGVFEQQSFNFNGSRWDTKLTSKVNLPADIDVEVTGRYQSAFKALQGNYNDFYQLNLGIRKKILKGKAVVNLGIRDIFASRYFEYTVNTPDIYLYNRRQRGRFMTLGFSYGFGKGEAMTYSGGRRRF